jgi:hypothetical protein
MPDITLCADGLSCESRNTCSRYLAVPSKYQSVALFLQEQAQAEAEECPHFWDTVHCSYPLLSVAEADRNNINRPHYRTRGWRLLISGPNKG